MVLFSFLVKDTKQRLFTPQLNHISMKLPLFPLLPQRNLIKPNQFCNSSTVEGCETDYCACTHVLQVKNNSVVELLLIDEGMRVSPLTCIFFYLYKLCFFKFNRK